MKRLFQALNLLGGLIVLVLVVITVAAVIARYVLGAPLQWTEEMSGLLMIWIVFIGAIACEMEDAHLHIDVVTNALRGRLRGALEIVVGFASVGLLGWMAWLGYQLAEVAAFKRTQILKISWFWLDIAVTVGAAGIAIVILLRLARRLSGRPAGIEE
ncbi:TRAP transporter small permease [Acidimangrovimonas sediminis]|uniref:TRAP transporter small permease n=1 Tax=Acidimangrovimonas sediminis TaxID=2056283 RepID=UPI000C80DE7A|nr:TRAP transporter small permease [Acidimangrovimonas sediminis]